MTEGNSNGSASEHQVPIRVLGALSCPRLGFLDPMFIAHQLVKMGIDLRKHSGAYWEQSLSKLMYIAVEEDYDYVLTLDYDTVFRPSDVMYQLNLMINNPQAAAIFPVQYRREANELILGIDGYNEGSVDMFEFNKHLIPATFGHFGCTIIRVSVLKQLPHPWLQSVPNPTTGMWDDGRVDADVNFWNKLRAAGFPFYCASRCVVGHLQQMITWPGKDYQPVHQYCGKYFEDGDAPREVIAAASKRATNGADHASEVSGNSHLNAGHAGGGSVSQGQDIRSS